MALIGEGREQRKRLLYLGTVTFLRERLDWPWGYLLWGTETLFTQKSAYGEWITDSRIELSLIKCECGKYPKTSSQISWMFVELILLPTLPLLFFTFFSFLFLFPFPSFFPFLPFPFFPSFPSVPPSLPSLLFFLSYTIFSLFLFLFSFLLCPFCSWEISSDLLNKDFLRAGVQNNASNSFHPSPKSV